MPDRRNRPPTVKRAKRLRGEMTEAEKKLWYRIRLKQIGGRHFRRQVAIGDYAVDFACLTAKLVIEVDGGQHDWRKGRRRYPNPIPGGTRLSRDPVLEQ